MLAFEEERADNYDLSLLDGNVEMIRPREHSAQGTGRGDIVGQYMDGSGVTHGFVLDAGGYTTVDIPGYPTTVLTGINPRGDVVGRCRGADGLDVAFVIRR